MLPAQDLRRELQLPDSSYLILTLDFLNAGTFNFDELPIGGTTRRRSIQYTMMSADVIGCDLVWRRITNVYNTSFSRGDTRTLDDFVVPLKAIDLATVEVRATASRSGYRPDPRPFEIVGYSRERSARPFTVTNVEPRITRRSHTFALTVRDQETAERLVRVLLDAARRCDSWNTKPRSRP